MNKMFVIFAVLSILFTVSASAATVTVISGTVSDGKTVVEGANVDVICNGNTKAVISGSDGKYYAFFLVSECNYDDEVRIHAYKGDAIGDGTGTVDYSKSCRINTALVDVTIPEFSVVAGALALVSALGIIAYKRR